MSRLFLQHRAFYYFDWPVRSVSSVPELLQNFQLSCNAPRVRALADAKAKASLASRKHGFISLVRRLASKHVKTP